MIKLKLIFILILCSVSIIFAQNKPSGNIKGSVLDKSTKQPLIGVNVIIEGTNRGAATDIEGNFIIKNIPVGTYNLQFSYVGYQPLKKANVAINPARFTVIEVELEEAVFEGEQIVVTPTYFEKPTFAVISSRAMDFEEIRQDPGSVEDIQRVVQALPAVVSGSDQLNEIIVRGGMPGENLFVMDNIDIPNPNHFSIKGAGGGSINMLNAYFVRDVEFYAGAFPAKYGDKASSVLNIKHRDGNREEMAGDFNIGMAGFGFLLEGPFADGKGSYILSGRKSFLDLIISSFGMTAVPRYNNLQAKVSYFLSNKNKLSINAVYGNDAITIEDEEDEEYTGESENVDVKNYKYIFGATLRTLWGEKGFSNLTVSRVFNHYYTILTDEAGSTDYREDSDEAENTIKFDFEYKLKRGLDFSAGFNLKEITFRDDKWSTPDTVYIYDIPNDPGRIIGIETTYPEWRVDQKRTTGKISLYTQIKSNISSNFSVNLGIRYNSFKYTGQNCFSPRFGFTYHVNPVTSLNLAGG